VIISQPQRCFLAITVAGLAVVITVLFGNPLFATNDDVGLAMIGAGFGIAAHPEPHLVFSHYGYGLLLNGLSYVVGPRAHGFVTLFAVGFSLSLFIYTLGKRADVLLAGILVAGGCIYTIGLLTPQFTVTSGVLVAAGLAGYIASAQRGEASLILWVAIYSSIILGGLIRPASAVAVCAVCAPLLIWIASRGTQIEKRSTRHLLAFLAIAGAAAYALEWAAYYFSNDWKRVLEYNFTRALFNDFFRVPWIPDDPAYRAAGWSENDYQIFKGWFASHDIYSFEKITAIAGSVATHGPTIDAPQILASFARLAVSPPLMAMLACQMLLVIAFRQARLGLLLLLIGVLLAVLASAATGRPPQDRVLTMIVAAGLIIGLAVVSVEARAQKLTRSQGIALSLAALLSLGIGAETLRQHRASVVASAAYRSRLALVAPLFEGRVVVWGASLMWEWLVTPTRIYPPVPGRVIPSIGAMSRTPVMDLALEKQGIRDLSTALCIDPDIHIIALHRSIQQLETFCEEHYQSRPGYRLVHRQRPRTEIYAREK
jgi:hypothetical protein